MTAHLISSYVPVKGKSKHIKKTTATQKEKRKKKRKKKKNEEEKVKQKRRSGISEGEA